MSDIKRMLEKLSNAHGISGWEGSVQRIVQDEISPYVDEVSGQAWQPHSHEKRGEPIDHDRCPCR